MEFLLYGAYGYTGKLIVELAADYGLKPVLAGRNAEKVKALAQETGLDSRVFALDKPAEVREQIKDFKLVLHAAGPFQYTAKPMMEACIDTKTHYLDITGEIEVFERGASLDKASEEAGIVMMPGVGFDVVPTDCMAAYLKQQLPDATELKLAFAMLGGGLSHGTATTSILALGEGSRRRENGKIVQRPFGYNAMTVPFMDKDIFVMSIPWGDVSTAYYSTGIPNIETFTRAHPKTHKRLKWQRYFTWFFRSSFFRNRAIKKIKKGPAGPTPEKRAKASSHVWGQVKNEKGETRAAHMKSMEGYDLTARTSLMITQRVLKGEVAAGFKTPSLAFGPDFILELEGTVRKDI